MISLKDTIVCITGASAGIGEACARAFAAEGSHLMLTARRLDRVKALADTLAAEYGIQTFAATLDVTRQHDVEKFFAGRTAPWNAIDILVNNAGLQKDAAFPDMTLTQWDTVLGVNLTGMFLCAREAVREMIRRGPRPEVSRATGKIINISSVHEKIPWSGHVNYAASKGGVKQLTESLAQEMAPHRIRVNSIAPGAIQTPINRGAWETPTALDSLLTLIPYGRIGLPEDIGKAAVWLASDDSDYVHGQTIFVDGGMTLYPEFAHGG